MIYLQIILTEKRRILDVELPSKEKKKPITSSSLSCILLLLCERKKKGRTIKQGEKEKIRYTERNINKRQTGFLFVFFNRDGFLVVLLHFLI
jgi:hypothetical protein